MGWADYSGIDVGDKVRVEKYVIGRLTEHPVPYDRIIGKVGVVVEKRKLTWISGGDKGWGLLVRLANRESDVDSGMSMPDDHLFESCDSEYELLSLVEKGDGQAIVGRDYELSNLEKKAERWSAFLTRVAEKLKDKERQGWTNAATWCAHLYLSCDKPAMDRVPSLIRKDGRINPKKVQKLFHERRLKVDDWCYECPIDVPGEFKHYRVPGLDAELAVNWQEIADFIADEHRKDPK